MASWELRISEVPEEMYSAILRGEGALIDTMSPQKGKRNIQGGALISEVLGT